MLVEYARLEAEQKVCMLNIGDAKNIFDKGLIVTLL